MDPLEELQVQVVTQTKAFVELMLLTRLKFLQGVSLDSVLAAKVGELESKLKPEPPPQPNNVGTG